MWRAGGCTKIWKKGGRQYRVVLHKIGGLAPLCQLCEETLKIFHPSIITPPPPPHSWLPTISSKNFPSPHYSHFWKISSPLPLPPLWREVVRTMMKNSFLEKLYTKSGGEASPRPFFKKSKLSIYLDQQSEMFFFCVLETKVLTTVWKNKSRSGISLPTSIFAW